MGEQRARRACAPACWLAPLIVTAAGAAPACSGDPQGGYAVTVHASRQVPELAGIEIVLSEDRCATPAVFAGDEPPGVVARWRSSREEPSTRPIGAVPAGDYGLSARGFSASCQVVAVGCSVAELEINGEDELEITLERVEGARCALGQTCGAAGRCTGEARACAPSRLTRWSAGSVLPMPFGYMGVATLGNELVALGGGTSSSDSRSDVFVAPLDATGRVGAWTAGTSMPEATGDPRVLVVGELLLVSGGLAYDGDGGAYASSSVLVGAVGMDGDLAWSRQTLPSGLVQHGLVAAAGSLYAIGGLGSPGGSPSDTVSRATLDPDDGTIGAWETLSDRALPEPSAVVGAFVHHNRIYVLTSDRTYVALLREAGLGAWATLEQPLPLAGEPAVAVLENHVYLLGGTRGGEPSGDVLAAELRDDGDLGPWAPVVGLPEPREGRRAVAAGGSLLVVGGTAADSSAARTLAGIACAP